MDKLPEEPVSVWNITNRSIYATPLFNYEGYESYRHAEIRNGELHLIRKKHFTYYILKEAIAQARQNNRTRVL